MNLQERFKAIAVRGVLLAAGMSTQASFTDKLPVIVLPVTTVNQLVLVPKDLGGEYLNIMPYGVGTADQTFKIRVWMYKKNGAQYIPTCLAEITNTLCTMEGLSGQVPTTGQKFVDLCANNSIGNPILNPVPANTPTWFRVKVDMADAVVIEGAIAGGSATSWNGLYW